jgi:hypothetical protein
MQETNDLELKDGVLESSGAPARRVIGDIPGSVLKAQFKLDDGRRLLVTADDALHEEVVHIVLLSPRLEVLDVLAIGGAYAPMDLVSGIHPLGEDAVVFSFLGDWKVRIDTRPVRFRALPRMAPISSRTPYLAAMQRWLRPTYLGLESNA